MKIIILILVLFFACAIAMTLLARLLETTRQIASLRGDLARNKDKMQEQMRELQRAQMQQEAAAQAQQNESAGAPEARSLEGRSLEAREAARQRELEEPKEL
jgi:predicted Holliday junction resolvase-like endonuclease